MSSSRIIAKNTLFLYIRMLLTMGVSLYTSRIVLKTLGIEDYGIYSIIGGVISLLSFFNAAMSSATQRFLAYDIGSGNSENLKNTFNATFIIHISIAIIVIILSETLGLWFVNYKLNVPLSRMNAVNWVYQFAMLTFMLNIIQVPFNALIIAKERMNIYAIMSIVEVAMKLIVVYILDSLEFDKLKSYSVLSFIVSALIIMVYQMYCWINFKESRFKWYYDKKYFNVLISYSGWSLFGNIASVARGQGINIVLNIFFGLTLNAAYGIMVQVQGAVNSFVNNFQLAVNPQIIKTYASRENDKMTELVFQSSRFSYYLMLIIIVPLIFNTDFVLNIWLKKYPEHTKEFIQLCLINILIDCISGPLMTASQASGKIKWYQIFIGSFIFLNLPLSYILLKIYRDPYMPIYISIIISLISLIFRLFFLKKMISFDIRSFIKNVIIKIVFVSTIIIITLIGIHKNTTINDYLSIIVCFFVCCINILAFGLNRFELKTILKFVKK